MTEGRYRVERVEYSVEHSRDARDPADAVDSRRDGEVGSWSAYLVDTTTGRQFGRAFRATTEAEAVARLERWSGWQRDHDAALQRLQAALREYHRAQAEGGLTAPRGDIADDQRRLDALERLDRARVDLDAVRRRRPG